MRGQQQVQLARDTQLVPGGGRLVRAGRTEPNGCEGGRRVAVDRVEHVLVPVAVEQRLRPLAPDVPDAAQVGEQPRLVRGRQRSCLGDLDLRSVAAVVHPLAADPRPLALLEVDDRPDEHDLTAVGVRVDDGKPRVLVREAPAADRHLGIEGTVLAHRRHVSR